MVRSALIVVDVQNDFADPKGSLYVPGGQEIIGLANYLAEHYDKVAYTQDWHPEKTSHFDDWPPHCVQDTWGAEFYPSLIIKGKTFRKGAGGEDGYSGFYMRDDKDKEIPTGLGEFIGSTRLVTIVGLATDYCVRATALDAHKLGHDVIVVKDGIRAVAPDQTDFVLQEFVEDGIGLR